MLSAAMESAATGPVSSHFSPLGSVTIFVSPTSKGYFERVREERGGVCLLTLVPCGAIV